MALQTDDKTDLNPSQADYDRKFNDIASAEKNGNFDDSNGNYNKIPNQSQSSDNGQTARQGEKDTAGWSNNVSPDKPSGVNQPMTIKGMVKKKGPIALIILLLGGGGLALGGLFSGAGLIVVIAENIKSRVMDATPSVLNLRGRQLMQKQLGILDKATTGLCTPVTVRCRFSTMTDRQIRLLKAAGVEVEPGTKALGINRTKVNSLSFKGQPITAENLKVSMTNSPELTNAINKSYNPRLVSFASSAFSKVMSAIGSTKAANLPKASLDKMKQALLDRVSGVTQASAEAGLKAAKDPKGGPPGYVDEAGTFLSVAEAEVKMAEVNAKFAASLKIKNGAQSTTEFFAKTAVKSTLIGVGLVSVTCSAWNIVRSAAAASRYLGAIQLANYAMVFLNTADSLKAGDATPEQIEYLGTTLTTPNSAGKTAMDSRGMKNVMYGDVTPIPDNPIAVDASGNPTEAATNQMKLDAETTQYVNGAGLSEVANNNLLQKIPGTTGKTDSVAYQIADDTCGYVNSTVGVALMLGTGVLLTTACAVSAILTVGATGIPCAASVATQLAIAGGIFGIVKLANYKLGQMLSGKLITGDENGNQSGNAVASGAGALNTQVGLGSGLGFMSKKDATKFQAFKDEANAQFAATDQLDHGQLDSSNPNTFAGRMVAVLAPYLSKTSSLSSSILSISKLPLMSFSTLFSPAKADAPYSDAGVCGDIDYANYATDINCNPIVGQTQATLDVDASTALDYMINNKHVDETSGAALSPDFKDFQTYCTNRTTAFGSHPADAPPSDLNTGKVCQDGYISPDPTNGPALTEMYSMFRAYLSYTVAEEGMSGEPIGGSPAATTDSGTAVSGDTKTLAKQLMDSPNIQFQTAQEKTDFQQIVDTGAETACGGSVPISSKLLSLIATAAQKYKITIGVVAAGHSCNGGYHPKGQALDINGVSLLDQPFLRMFDWTSSQSTTAVDFYQFLDGLAGTMGIRLELGQQGCFKGASPKLSNTSFVADTCNHIHVGVTAP